MQNWDNSCLDADEGPQIEAATNEAARDRKAHRIYATIREHAAAPASLLLN